MLSKFSLNGPIVFDPTDVQAQATALEPYGGTVTGTVSVNTQVEVHPFIVPYVYSGGAPLIFNSSQSFPFTFVVPNTATPGP